MIALLLLLCPLYFVIAPVDGSTCYERSGSFQLRSFYCGNGCCGSSSSQYCCTSDGAVAGAVIGSTIGIAFFAAFIILCIRYYNRRTVIITPTVVPATTVAVVTHGGHTSMYPTQTYPAGVYMPHANSHPAVAPPPYSMTTGPAITEDDMAAPQPTAEDTQST